MSDKNKKDALQNMIYILNSQIASLANNTDPKSTDLESRIELRDYLIKEISEEE